MIKTILAFSLSLVTENLASYINTVRLYNFKSGWGGVWNEKGGVWLQHHFSMGGKGRVGLRIF